jgi:hypothetical protein
MGVWEGVAIYSLKSYAGLPCPTLLLCGRITPETTLQPFMGWPACRRPPPLGHPTPYASVLIVLNAVNSTILFRTVFHGVSMKYR